MSAEQKSYGIVLLFDQIAEQRIRGAWDNLATDGISSSLPKIICAMPHITVSIASNINLTNALPQLQQCAEKTRPFQVSFGSIGAFAAPSGTAVFLQPTVTRTLLELHAEIVQTLQLSLIEPGLHYKLGLWTPHCSLAIGLERTAAERALAQLLLLKLPIHAQIQALALLEVKTAGRTVIAGCELARWQLGSGQTLPNTFCHGTSSCSFHSDNSH